MNWSLRLAKSIRLGVLAGTALASSIAGGMLWFVIWKGLGGPDEPHGNWVIGWVSVTMMPIYFALLWLNNKGSDIGLGRFVTLPIHRQAIFNMVFLGGFILGAMTFYDLPIAGKVGFRRYFEAVDQAFVERETYLVLIWTLLVCVPSFGLMMVSQLVINKIWGTTSCSHPAALWTLVKQIVTGIVPTSVFIIWFVWWFGEDPKYVPTRGIAAGIVLRTSMFFGLLVGLGALTSRFKKVRYLGSGANADVYRVYDRVTRRLCALKLFKESLTTDETRYLKRELEIVTELDHPGLVKYYSTEVEDLYGRPMIRMEFVTGRTLKEIAKWTGRDCRRRDLREVTEWLLACLEPLDYLHRSNIVHRDVHAGNVLLQDDGRIRLLDYGTARTVSMIDANTQFRVAGSMTHAAPEKWIAPAHAGRESDYFSVGVMAYLLATGRLPFWEDSMIRLYEVICSAIYEPPSRLCEDLPLTFDQVIATLLQPDPKTRLCSRSVLETGLAECIEVP